MAIATKPRPKTTVRHKKRTGAHQRRNKHFKSAYWPYLPLLLVIAVGVIVNAYLSKPQVLGYATATTTYSLLENTNRERMQHSQSALTLNTKLTQAAQAKANDMVARNYWSHNTPDGQEPWVFINNAGYAYDAAGENLAYGFDSSSQTVTAWMNSPEHRKNLLNSKYKEVGFGIANSPSYQHGGQETIVVAMYGEPSTTPTILTPQSNDTATAAATAGSKVSRIQLATNTVAPWTLYGMLLVTLFAAVFVTQKHSRAWHKRLKKGEKFILSHPLLDVALVCVVMAGYILIQTVGAIQ